MSWMQHGIQNGGFDRESTKKRVRSSAQKVNIHVTVRVEWVEEEALRRACIIEVLKRDAKDPEKSF